MNVHVQVHNKNPLVRDYDTIEWTVPAFWPVPREGEMLTIHNTDHPTIPEGEEDTQFYKVYLVDYNYDHEGNLLGININVE